MSDEFRQWLAAEMKNRRLSQRALARMIEISHPVISRVLSGENQPSLEFCIKVAHALGEPPARVLRLAGILPPSEDDPTLEELREVVEHLPPNTAKPLSTSSAICSARENSGPGPVARSAPEVCGPRLPQNTPNLTPLLRRTGRKPFFSIRRSIQPAGPDK